MTHLATTTQRALDTATPTGTQGFRTYYVYDGNDVAFTLVRPLDQHHLADPAAGPQMTQM